MLKGYRILARRARTPAGEIDLIAKRGRTVAFVEVKARKTKIAALEAVTPRAQGRIIRAAELWMARHSEFADNDWRFDIVAVLPGRFLPFGWPEHFPDAWRPNLNITAR